MSFVVADIDEEEGIIATIYDINNNMLGSQTLLAGDPLAGNNIGTLISFNETNISRLLITPMPSSDGGIGWGVDNISYETMQPIPEPTTMLLLGTGLAGVAGAARRKKKIQA